ncbi:MAG: thioredoxin family protein [Bacilli bacterium]|nr:thioredoxin family protein [Bacilli bacterium]
MKVVKINAIWCSGCLIMNNVWNKILNNYNIETITLDYDVDEEEVKKYDVGKILPVFIFYKEDKEVKRVVGELSYSEMEKVVKELLDE